MSTATLVTIGPSHYCEKARWALERAAIPFVEEAHAPMFHWLFTLPRTKTKTVPILVTDTVRLSESRDILAYCDQKLPESARLYPADPELRAQVKEYERLFDDTIGVYSRRLAYCYLVNERAFFLETMSAGLSATERALLRIAHKGMIVALRKAFKTSDEAKVSVQAKLEETLSHITTQLADGRAYLVGDRLTAADLTLVALLGPVMQYRRANLDDVPAPMRSLISHMRNHPVGVWALKTRNKMRSVVVA